jgi:hypothetical protein
MSHNSTPIYRIGGWDNWERQSGRIVLRQSQPSALWQGNGLRAEYFSTADLNGSAQVQRIDKEIWFGPMWGSARFIPARKMLKGSVDMTNVGPSKMSARWTGFFEPPVSENFTFTIYTYGHADLKKTVGSKVRLWVDGEEIIDEWNDVKQQRLENEQIRTRACLSCPIALNAGQLVPIRLDYVPAGDGDAHVHLFFQSDSFDLRHVPYKLLYPDAP